ncbi:MAG: 30S ribosomal protein S9 [Candidatus Micrarchaeota archaeon]|nr:30S ribosomal protein S9 [Candidatus Micrarchaeota archaeon]
MAATTKKKAKKKKEVHESVFRGKRKESIARASISKGKGVVRINSQLLASLENKYAREIIAEPLRIAPEIASQVDISLNVVGGGAMGQAQACRVAIAHALIGFSGDESVRKKILEHDRFMLIEDSRRVEPKKYKGPKARARFQKSYR